MFGTNLKNNLFNFPKILSLFGSTQNIKYVKAPRKRTSSTANAKLVKYDSSAY
jgi:hypothetical protein